MTVGNFKALAIGSLIPIIPIQLVTVGFSYAWIWVAFAVGTFIGAKYVEK